MTRQQFEICLAYLRSGARIVTIEAQTTEDAEEAAFAIARAEEAAQDDAVRILGISTVPHDRRVPAERLCPVPPLS